VDVNCWGRDGDAANGEKIRSTAKETERARATQDIDTLTAMAAAATEGRRKRRHSRSSSSSEEDEEEEKKQTIEPKQWQRRRRQQWRRMRSLLKRWRR
jgi:hypothetical protein